MFERSTTIILREN